MKVTIQDIENDLFDLDTEYREALANSLMKLNYVSDSPLNLSIGTERQQQELDRVYNMPLKSKQIKEIINYMSKEMKGDFQYGQFSPVIKKYLNIANQIEKNEKSKERYENIKYLVTHTLSNEERKEYESKGLYCYDLRDSDFGNDIASIEKRVCVNRIGSMVTNKEIKLGDKYPYDFVDYNTFVARNKSVDTIEKLFSESKNKEETVLEKEENNIQFYDEKEIKKIIKDKDRLYYADDGMAEVIVREQDIADFIIKANDIAGETANLKFYKMNSAEYKPVLTTMGSFLDKADPSLRKKIIDRLNLLLTTDEVVKDFKVIDEDMFEKVKSSIQKDKKNKEAR